MPCMHALSATPPPCRGLRDPWRLKCACLHVEGRGGAHGELRDAQGPACSWQLEATGRSFSTCTFVHSSVCVAAHSLILHSTHLPAACSGQTQSWPRVTRQTNKQEHCVLRGGQVASAVLWGPEQRLPRCPCGPRWEEGNWLPQPFLSPGSSAE